VRAEPRRGLLAALDDAVRGGAPLILDGAVGTALDDRGADTSAPLWSGRAPLDTPSLLEAIHSEHAEAGAAILTTCTFRTTARAFRAAGRPDGAWREAASAAVGMARRIADGAGAFVVGSIGPLADCYRPDLAPPEAQAEPEHAALARTLAEAGVDALWLETFPSASEARAAARAAAGCGIPFGVCFVTRADGALLSGEPLAEAALAAAGLGAAFVGVNCVPPGHVDAALPILSRAVALPLAAYANLGRGQAGQDWSGSAHLDPGEYAALAARWVDSGAAIVGGCCGSTAAHVAAIATALGRGRVPRR
jgi:S-methylmethionine-dependent homocysteine/selenocysteine methylase